MATQTAPSAGHPQHARRPLLLIASAQRLICRMLGEVLAGAGYRVATAHTGDQVMTLCRGQSPDLVMLDLAEPDDAAYALCARVREAAGAEPLPILALADQSDAHTIARLVHAGVTDFLPKPVDVALLKARVRQALQHRTMARWVRQQNSLRVDHAPTDELGTWRYDPQRRELRLSGRLSADLHPDQALAGQQLWQLLRRVHPDDRRRVRTALRSVLHGGRPRVLEHRLVDADGLVHHVRHRMAARHSGNSRGNRLTGQLWMLSGDDATRSLQPSNPPLTSASAPPAPAVHPTP